MNWKVELKRVLLGREEISWKQRAFRGVALALMLYICAFMGFAAGFYEGTGTFPFVVRTQAILPPEIDKTTSAQVTEFVEADPTGLEQYRHGFNCVEFALVAARNAWWAGVSAVPVRLDFTDETAHMILGFPTDDQGWMFLNPEGSKWIKLSVGGKFFDKEIDGIYYLYDLVWEPIEWGDNK